MTVTFMCGTTANVQPDKQRPICPHCGTRRIRSSKTRPPRFHGTVHGPLASYEDVPAMTMALGGGE